MKEINGMYYFDGTMDFMENYKHSMHDIFMGELKYWYITIGEQEFLDYIGKSKEEAEVILNPLPNGWCRCSFITYLAAAPHFLLKRPDGYIFGLICLTMK